MPRPDRVCVYCASSDAVPEVYREAARALGHELLRRGLDLVYGGGRVGLMGVLADTVLAGGGRVTGVIPDRLVALELGHEGCTELIVVPDMHARKMRMARLADAFVALPGGWGTLEELFEAITWRQLDYHRKPVGLLDVNGYYGELLAWTRRARAEGFLPPGDEALLLADTDPARLLDRMGLPGRPAG